MTLGRWTGPRLLDRYGRVATIRGLAALALIGLLLFVFSPWAALAFAGVLLWGMGACLGYPVAISAAADEPRLAAQRVSTVSGIGQLAYLGGPPLIGLLASAWTIQHALIVGTRPDRLRGPGHRCAGTHRSRPPRTQIRPAG